MIFQQELNETFLDAFLLLFQQRCLADEFFLKKISSPRYPRRENEESYIK
jgi:hypothetical protein